MSGSRFVAHLGQASSTHDVFLVCGGCGCRFAGAMSPDLSRSVGEASFGIRCRVHVNRRALCDGSHRTLHGRRLVVGGANRCPAAHSAWWHWYHDRYHVRDSDVGGSTESRRRTLLADTLAREASRTCAGCSRVVIRFTLFFELGGAVLLAGRFFFDHRPAAALWHAVFHSISAFCNAGFSLNDDSLMRYQGDPVVNVTIMALVIGGGLGYPVMIDLSRNWHGPWAERWERLMLHTKIMLIGTASMLAFGTIGVLVLEWDGALAGLPVGRCLLVATFHSVTCRTAGFNTIEVGTLTNATLFVSILLMVVGAGPCSTGGGFKVSTLSVLVLRAWATFLGYERVNFGKRTLPRHVTDRAVTTALLFGVISVLALTGLLICEQSEAPHTQIQSQGLFLDAMFEVVSALGTVGLSTGMTPNLTPLGRAIIIVLMFVGRLGPITVVAALSREPRSKSLEYASEELLIG